MDSRWGYLARIARFSNGRISVARRRPTSHTSNTQSRGRTRNQCLYGPLHRRRIPASRSETIYPRSPIRNLQKLFRADFIPVFLDPRSKKHGTFFTTFETFVNPNTSESLLSLNELSLQAHWHVFIIGPNNEELNWFEFPNVYKIHEAIEQLLVMVKSNPCQNFDLAKLEFQSKFTIDDIPLGNRWSATQFVL